MTILVLTRLWLKIKARSTRLGRQEYTLLPPPPSAFHFRLSDERFGSPPTLKPTASAPQRWLNTKPLPHSCLTQGIVQQYLQIRNIIEMPQHSTRQSRVNKRCAAKSFDCNPGYRRGGSAAYSGAWYTRGYAIFKSRSIPNVIAM